DFGYSFDVVVNASDAGQGSLRQFLINANGLGNSGLAQAGRAAGIEHAVFMLPDGTAQPGMNAGYWNTFVNGVATIALASALPPVVDPVVVDARTAVEWTGRPVVELNGASAGSTANGFTVTAGGSTIAGFVIDRFWGNGVGLFGGGATVAGNW